MIIFETVFGSHLYGTATEKSDHDFKGVYIPSASDILSPRIPDGKNYSTGDSSTKNTSEDVDRELFALHKFFDMIIKGDMNAYEMLFSKGLTRSEHWDFITAHRETMLSRKCKGFVGYVQRQAATYGIRGDRFNEVKWMVSFLKEIARNLLNDKSKLIDYPDIESVFTQSMKQSLRDFKYTYIEKINVNGNDITHFVCCDRKVPLTVTVAHAIDVYRRVLDNYGNRARAAASSEGIDWKAVSHAIRIGEQAVELLMEGEITFPRPNAERLLRIKLGQENFADIQKEMDFLLESIVQLGENSKLPEEPNIRWMKEVQRIFYRESVINNYGDI